MRTGGLLIMRPLEELKTLCLLTFNPDDFILRLLDIYSQLSLKAFEHPPSLSLGSYLNEGAP